VLVERSSQLQEFDRLFQECQEGKGGVSLISGPVASGKTELLKVFVEKAVAAGATVLEAVGSARERDLPFGVLDQLCSALPVPTDRQRLGQLLSDSASRLPESGDDSPGYLRNRANQELWATVGRLAEQAPVVIAVDDLQFADLTSLQSLLYICGQLRSARVLIMVTQLDCPLNSDQQRAVLATELLRQPQFGLLRVEPLSEDGVREMLTRQFGAAVDSDTAGTWHRMSGGSPFLLKALIADCRMAGGGTEPVPGPEFAKTTLACLHRSGRRFLAAARGLAVLAESESFCLLPQLLDEEEDSTRKIVAVMNASGVLDSHRFRNPAARRAVLTELPIAERTELHRRAACLLHDGGAEPRRIAVHLVAARYAGELWARDVLMGAAQGALRRDDVGFAVQCLRLAETACQTDEERIAVAILRVQTEFRVNPANALRHLEVFIDALREDRVRLDQMVAMLRPLLWRGRQNEAALIIERLERAAGNLDDQSSAELYVICEWLSSTQPRLLAGARQLRARFLDGVRVIGVANPMAQAAVMLSGVLNDGPDENTVPTAEGLLRTTSLDDSTVCSIHSALLALVYSDRLDLAEQWCDSWVREAVARRAPTWQALFTSARAEIAIRQGDLRAGRHYGWSALNLIPRSSWGVTIGSVMASLVITATSTGEADNVDLWPAETPDGLFDTRSGVYYVYARGRRQLAANRLHAALEDLLTCGRWMCERSIDLPSFVPWRADTVHVLVRLGRKEQARTLAAEQLTRPAVQQPRVRGISLRAVAATEDDPRQREVTLRQAIDALEECGDRVELAYAIADLSKTYDKLGDPRRARAALRRAILLAEEQSLEPLLRRLVSPAVPVAMVPQARQSEWPGRDSQVLSAAERRVVMLAATGHTNREIADTLYITVSTVEQHLTRSYRKLGVSGRADLAMLKGATEDALFRSSARAAFRRH